MKTTTAIIITALALLLAATSCSTSSNTTAELSPGNALCRQSVPAFNEDNPLWTVVEITEFQSDQLEIKNDELLCQAQSIRKGLPGSEHTIFYCVSLPLEERKRTFFTFIAEDCLEVLRENAGN